MNDPDFDRSVLRERDQEMLQEVHALRLQERLRASRKRRRALRRIFGVRDRLRKLASADLLAERR